MLRRAFVVDGVAALVGTIVTSLEADDNLVPPRPDAVVGGPAAEAAFLLVDDNVFDRLRTMLGEGDNADGGERKGNDKVLFHSETPEAKTSQRYLKFWGRGVDHFVSREP